MFESAINAPVLSPKSLGKGVVFSVAAHACAVAIAVGAAAHKPPPSVEPPEVKLLISVPSPPPPPPPLGGQAVAHSEPVKKPHVKPDSYVPRDPVKEEIKAADPTPPAPVTGEPDGQADGEIGGTKGGQVGGVIGGTGTDLHGDPQAVGVVAPPPEPSNMVLPFGEGMNRPQMLAGPDVAYPRQAREARVEGTLLAKCVITPQGTLQSCRIIKSLPFMDQPVLEALAARRYTPVSFQGRPVAVEYVIPFKFKLQ